MAEMEQFEFEENFNPFEDAELEMLDEEDDGAESDYVVPVIPDADKSIVPEEVELPAEQRIENLLKGIPGQQFRILRAVSACLEEPRTLNEIIEEVDAEYADMVSVYSTGRLVSLLEGAGALERIVSEKDSAAEAPEESPAEEAIEGLNEEEDLEEGEGDALQVEPALPYHLIATQAGADAVHERVNFEIVKQLLEEDPRYVPVYKRILEMCTAEQGRMIREINAVVDPDPVCKEPRRFSQYFLMRLENVNAVRFDTAWRTTPFGNQALDLGLFEDVEAAGDISAAEPARQKELEKEAEFERQAAQRAAFAAEKAAREAEEAKRLEEENASNPQETEDATNAQR